jgi:hypothetical protein
MTEGFNHDVRLRNEDVERQVLSPCGFKNAPHRHQK